MGTGLDSFEEFHIRGHPEAELRFERRREYSKHESDTYLCLPAFLRCRGVVSKVGNAADQLAVNVRDDACAVVLNNAVHIEQVRELREKFEPVFFP